MSHAKITKRYFYSVLGAGLGYIAAVAGVSFALNDADPLTPLAIFLAFLPGVFLAAMAGSMWVYLRDVDEVARHFLTRAMMAALFVTLVVSGMWGLAELFLNDLPRVPVFFVFPLVMGLFGVFAAFGPARGMNCA